MAATHDPVLLDRVVALLMPALDREGAVLVDATLGLGGHSEAVLARCELARVVGIDRDPDALALAGERLAPYGDRFTGVHAVYDEIPEVISGLGLSEVDGVLFDLGVSSMQLDVPDRGFAYSVDAPLDMRMDGSGRSGGPTAADVLNTYSAAELTRVLRDYGEEKFARKIAGAIVRRRETHPVHVVGRPRRAPVRRDPGARAPDRRAPREAHLPGPADGGQRRARRAAAGPARGHRRHRRRGPGRGRGLPLAGGPPGQAGVHAATRSEVPLDLPFVPEGSEPALRLVTRGAEKAGAAETAANPRAASVRLRALERVTRPGKPTTGAA